MRFISSLSILFNNRPKTIPPISANRVLISCLYGDFFTLIWTWLMPFLWLMEILSPSTFAMSSCITFSSSSSRSAKTYWFCSSSIPKAVPLHNMRTDILPKYEKILMCRSSLGLLWLINELKTSSREKSADHAASLFSLRLLR